MASPPDGGEYDYTDGASPREISHALSESEFRPRPRRDSQVGSAYDDEDGNPSSAIYDGYVAGTIPSSVTSMHHDRVILWNPESRASTLSRGKRHRPSISRTEHSGISSSRKKGTRDSDIAVVDDDDEGSQHDEDTLDDVGQESIRGRLSKARTRSRRKTPERLPSRSNVFDSIAGIFSRTSQTPESLTSRPESISRQPSVSVGSKRRQKTRRSMSGSSAGGIEHPLIEDNGDDEERWGYTSGEEEQLSPSELSDLSSHAGDISVYDTSIGSSPPASPTTSLPILPGGANSFFGDTRIDMSVEPGFQELPKPPPGPPSRQSIYIVDEDMTVLFVGYEVLSWRRWAWLAGCIGSFGALGLAGIWKPTLWLRWVTREVPFESLGEPGSGEGIITVEVRHCI